MSLPPGFLDELRTRLSLSQVVGRKVMWDTRKSNQAKGDMWAPCPFHQEKTASFHVDDRKGFYYCFGCHAKGDAIAFIRETENLGFMEAVQALAAEAGMEMPAEDPAAQARAARRTDLTEIMEMAVRQYRRHLSTAQGIEAKEYLQRRGLGPEIQERFGIGFAPDARRFLWDHLTGQGIDGARLIAAGLAAEPDGGGAPYDRFRGRIMFPIRDPRGRCIAFGGRAMDPADDAKYLNSQDTELFDKSRVLYHHGPAREAAGKGKPLIVAEGYMDVIALAMAGFDASVAPLGTAVTEHHLQLLWRIADEPIIALDGDGAGLRAAYRTIDVALPLLEAGKSLRFALMPQGMDPDDLLRAKGPVAVQDVLDRALPMVQLLWQRETDGRVFDSPERRASLDKAVREKIKMIQDPSIRSHYGEAIKDLRWALFSPRRQKGGGARQGFGRGGRWQPPASARQTTRASLLVAAGEGAHQRLREALILATVICTPQVFDDVEGQLEGITCSDPEHERLRGLILRHAGQAGDALRARLETEAGGDALEKLLSLPHVALAPAVRRPGDPDIARMTIAEELNKLDAERGLSAEVREAAEDLAGVADEAVTWRLGQAAEERQRALRSQTEDTTEYDLAENGARISRDEREKLEKLLNGITFSKPGR